MKQVVKKSYVAKRISPEIAKKETDNIMKIPILGHEKFLDNSAFLVAVVVERVKV